jgi:sulfide:quinone oxidoreductase
VKTLLILGAGTGGTMVANRMAQKLDPAQWRIVIVDRDETHYYQPGFLFIPFGVYQPADVIRPKRLFLPRGVEVIFSDIEVIEPGADRVRLVRDRQVIDYDILVIATGSRIAPEEVAGLTEGGWGQNIFDFYTLEGASALREFLKHFEGGRVVVNVAEMPIKCPVAPLEFLFLADWYFRERELRLPVELIYTTPLPGAFAQPYASALLGRLLEQKGIYLEGDFGISEVDSSKQVIRSYDGREVSYDLLVSIPTNMGASVIRRSGMGDELDFVRTDKHTLQSKQWENVWVIGDAASVPTSKTISAAHFMLETLTENLVRYIDGLPPLATFDGHANCYLETGFGKGLLIDFNYDTEPLPGMFPLPGVGPFTLLKESAANHWGKLSFRWVYWNLLLKGHPLPIAPKMSMAGKWTALS